MPFKKRSTYIKRIQFERGATKSVELPPNNLFSMIKMLLKAQVNVVTDTAVNAPDFQVMHLIREIKLIKNQKDAVWTLSGEVAAAMFTHRNGVAAAGNNAIAGAVANDVSGQHYLTLPMYVPGSVKPSDFFADTRKNKYHLQITWRNPADEGVLFGTINGTVTYDEAEIYLDIEVEDGLPIMGPKGSDSLENRTPLIAGYKETITDVSATNSKFQIEVPDYFQYRGILFYTTHEANANQEVGQNDIFTDELALMDSKRTDIIHSIKAESLREETSLRFGLGSNLGNGLYYLPLDMYGSALDAIITDNKKQLFIEAAVAKKANTTRVRALFITQEQQ